MIGVRADGEQSYYSVSVFRCNIICQKSFSISILLIERQRILIQVKLETLLVP